MPDLGPRPFIAAYVPRLGSQQHHPGQVGTVYLLHLDTPLSSGQQHYTGWTQDLGRRIYDHRHNGSASSGVCRKARREGVGFTVAAIVEGATKRDERVVQSLPKRYFCPMCDPQAESFLRQVYGDRLVLAPEVVEVRRRVSDAPGASPS